MSRVTMAEVARQAGVNKATVSRALKGDPRISLDTRQKVWDAAKELGYQLDTVASGLSSRRTGVIGVMLESLWAPWLGSFLCGVHRVLSRYKMEFLLVEANGQDTSIAHALRRLEGRKADGIIWRGASKLGDVDCDIPIIAVDSDGGGDFRVDMERDRTLKMVRAMAGSRPVRCLGNTQGPFGFLGALQDCEETGNSAFTIWDGSISSAVEEGARPDLICGDLQCALRYKVPCLCYPGLELGLLSARVLTNVIRGLGVRPRHTLVRPMMLSPSGEPLFPESS